VSKNNKRIIKMKSLIAIACALFCANIYARTAEEVFAEFKSVDKDQIKYFLSNVTTDEWRQIADLEIASDKRLNPSAFLNMISKKQKNCEPLLNEYDNKFAVTTLPRVDFNLKTGFECMPKCALKRVEIISEKRPVMAETCKSVKGDVESVSLLQNITMFAEKYANPVDVLWFRRDFTRYSERILLDATKELKKLIRKKGWSFIARDDGSNPVQEVIDSLSSALNRPRMQGLREWVAEWYPDYVWTEPSWMSEEDLKKLMDDVFYGQTDLDMMVQGVLRANLGLEGYNEFIKKYNK
jgi:hypothetical protein